MAAVAGAYGEPQSGGTNHLLRLILPSVPVALAGEAAFAGAVHVDGMPFNKIISGNFEVFRQDANTPVQQVFELLNLVVDEDFSAAGAQPQSSIRRSANRAGGPSAALISR